MEWVQQVSGTLARQAGCNLGVLRAAGIKVVERHSLATLQPSTTPRLHPACQTKAHAAAGQRCRAFKEATATIAVWLNSANLPLAEHMLSTTWVKGTRTWATLFGSLTTDSTFHHFVAWHPASVANTYHVHHGCPPRPHLSLPLGFGSLDLQTTLHSVDTAILEALQAHRQGWRTCACKHT